MKTKTFQFGKRRILQLLALSMLLATLLPMSSQLEGYFGAQVLDEGDDGPDVETVYPVLRAAPETFDPEALVDLPEKPRMVELDERLFVELSNETGFNTGTKACRAVGSSCIGFSETSQSACLLLNTDDSGLCSNTLRSAQASCDEALGTDYTRAYVECQYDEDLSEVFQLNDEFDVFEEKLINAFERTGPDSSQNIVKEAGEYLVEYLRSAEEISPERDLTPTKELRIGDRALFHPNGSELTNAALYKFLAQKHSSDYEEWFEGYVARSLENQVSEEPWFVPYEKWFRQRYTDITDLNPANPVNVEMAKDLLEGLPFGIQERLLGEELLQKNEINLQEAEEALNTFVNELQSFERELQESEEGDALENQEITLNDDQLFRAQLSNEEIEGRQAILDALQTLQDQGLPISELRGSAELQEATNLVINAEGSLTAEALSTLQSTIENVRGFVTAIQLYAEEQRIQKGLENDPFVQDYLDSFWLEDQLEMVSRVSQDSEIQEDIEIFIRPTPELSTDEKNDITVQLYNDLEIDPREEVPEEIPSQSLDPLDPDECSQDEETGEILDDNPRCYAS